MGPLEGLIVVDATWGAPGAIATLLLADNGADVIKIERPGLAEDALARLAWNRGKRSIALDVRKAEDRETLLALLAKADIFVSAFSPRQAEELGLDFKSLSARFPRLIHCAITGYGFDTPWRDEPGYDCLVAAKLGLMVEQASAGREGPIFLGHPHIAYGTGFMAAISTLSAVRARRETGRGQLVDVSLLDGVLAQSPMNWWWHPDNISYVEVTEGGQRTGFGRKRLITACFECADGEFIQIHTGGQGGFKATMEIFGFGDITQTPSGPDMSLPLNDEEYTIARDYIPEAFKLKTRAEWLPEFEAKDLAVLPVLRQGEVLDDEQVKFAGRAHKVQHPTLGELKQAGPPLSFEKSPISAPKPAPARNQDEAAVRALAAAPTPLPPRATGRKLGHALQGVRVLDFSSFFATAYGAKILSDLGADVIQIETPGGDQMRPLPNPFEACQRGKRNIVLNLKTADGRAIMHELVRTADVVMHNQRPGKAEKIALDYATLSKINPKLVYCYLPGFGSAGPKSLHKSFAPLQSGFTGLLYEGAGEGNAPVRSVEGNEDYYNGFLGAVAALVGLEQRAKSGEGQYIESPQLHSSLFVGSHHFLGPNGESITALPLDHDQTGWGPLYRLYKTSDHWICIACVGDGAFKRLAHALDLPAGTTRDSADLAETLATRFATMSSAEASERLRGGNVACEVPAKAPVVPKLLWEDWAFASKRVFEHADSLHGRIREIGHYMRLSDTPPQAKGPAPRLGQHTREILAELGHDEAKIDTLAAVGAVYVDPKTPAASHTQSERLVAQ